MRSSRGTLLCLGAATLLGTGSCLEIALDPRLPSPGALSECNDGIDNDVPPDGHVDFPDDPGCEDELDPFEIDPVVPRACSDLGDNDGDGRIDFDLNGNGTVDPEDDPGCESAADDDERNATGLECADMLDNDGDGRIDWQSGGLGDPDCDSANDDSETSECADGIDNDFDGLVDFPADPGCTGVTDNSERL